MATTFRVVTRRGETSATSETFEPARGNDAGFFASSIAFCAPSSVFPDPAKRASATGRFMETATRPASAKAASVRIATRSSATSFVRGPVATRSALAPFSRARLALKRRAANGVKGDFSSSPSGE